MFDDVLRDRNPAPVIAVTSIAIGPWSIEVQFSVLSGDCDDLGRLCLSTGVDIAFTLRQPSKQVNFSHIRLRPWIAPDLVPVACNGRTEMF